MRIARKNVVQPKARDLTPLHARFQARFSPIVRKMHCEQTQLGVFAVVTFQFLAGGCRDVRDYRDSRKCKSRNLARGLLLSLLSLLSLGFVK